MKFSQHLGKGAWGFATKLLPAVYGVVMTVLVFKVLPKEESGELALFQVIFGMIFTFADSFALQAIVKFGVDTKNDLGELLSATSLLFFGFLAVVLGAMGIFPNLLGSLMNAPLLPRLIPSLIFLTILTVPRVIASKIFQMRFHTKELFFMDLIYFGGSSVIVAYYGFAGKLSSAYDVIFITMITAAASSVYSLIAARRDILFKPRFTKAMVKKIFDFTRYQTATGTVHVFQQNLDSLLVPAFLGVEALANYQVAKFFFKGFDVLRDTQGIFVFPASSKYHASGDTATLQKIIEKATSFLFILMVPVCILLIIFAPTIFHLIYGTKFDVSIDVFRVLIATGFVLPVVMVAMSALVGMGRVKEVFRIILASLIINVALAVVLLPALGLIGAATAFAISMIVQAVAGYRVMKRDVPLEARELLLRGVADGKHFVMERITGGRQ
ncbi:MAG TPA: oligosaccharide flippase family protein [Candidatus Kapabacteria bacterium]|nr:oligosaccharide flippase family protein [Candidatus Kapabacteria bacterium]